MPSAHIIADQSVLEKMDRILKSGSYADIDEIIKRAIEMLDEYEHSKKNTFKEQFKERLKNVTIKPFFVPKEKIDIIKIAEKPYGKLSRGLISHWYNRILPTKWILRQLVDYSKQTKSEWVSLEDFEDYIKFNKLPEFENAIKEQAREFVGFPSIPDSLKIKYSDYKDEKIRKAQFLARDHFFQYYFGKIIQKLIKTGTGSENFLAKGACFEMKFVECGLSINPDVNDLDKNERYKVKKSNMIFLIRLTPRGTAFDNYENKILDYVDNLSHDLKRNPIDTTKQFSEEEVNFILDHIYKPTGDFSFDMNHFKLEEQIVTKILEKKGQELVKKEYHDLFDKTAKKYGYTSEELQKNRLTQHRSATMMRLVELGLVRKGGKKNMEVYAIV
jgi:Arc/MetJ-type ribon-helix-helix transcriptional regulator